MAKGINKYITLSINGQQVENSMAAINNEIKKQIRLQQDMTIGSEEYNKSAAKIRELKGIYELHRKDIHSIKDSYDNSSKSLQNFTNLSLSLFAGVKMGTAAYNKLNSEIKEFVSLYATLDDAKAAVMKTTEMTKEEVDDLNRAFLEVDSRTTIVELNSMAEMGGRIGIAKEEILEFTKAINISYVALKDSFSGGSEEIAKVLGKLKTAYKETKDMNIDEAYMAIGSAINEVGANTKASEQNIANFATRVGALPDVFKPSITAAFALGAAFEESSIEADIASRAYGILLRAGAQDVEKFAAVMQQPVNVINDLINSNPMEFALQFSESLRGMDATQTATTLKDLGLNADGVNKAIGAMSSNTERFREILDLSNKSFEEANSLMSEFEKVNYNQAAALEKSENAIINNKTALGESLIPLQIKMNETSALSLEIMSDLVKWAIANKEGIMALAAATSAYLVVKNRNLLIDNKLYSITKMRQALDLITIARTEKKNAVIQKEAAQIMKAKAAEEFKKVATLQGAAAERQMTIALAARTKAEKASVTAMQASTIATNSMKTAMAGLKAAIPFGLVIAGITMAIPLMQKLVGSTTEAEKAMKDFNKETAKQEAEAKTLFDTLQKTTEGSTKYEAALQKLKDLYPDVINAHIDEEGRLRDIDAAYKDVTTSIRTNTAERLKAENVSAIWEKLIAKQKNGLEKLRDEFTRFYGEAAANDAMTLIQDGLQNGNIDEVIEQLNEKFRNLNGTILVWFDGLPRTAGGAIKRIKELGEEAIISVENVEKLFNGIIGGNTGTSNGSDGSVCTGDYKTCKCQTCTDQRNKEAAEQAAYAQRLTKFEEFEKDLAKFRRQNHTASMNDFEKEKAGITDKYNAQIELAKEHGELGIAVAKELETEKQEAVTQLAEKYLKKYTTVIENAQKDIVKAAQKHSNNGESSKLINAVLGAECDWKAQADAISEQIMNYRFLLSTTTDEQEISNLQRTIEKLQGAIESINDERLKSITNILKKETADVIKFIEKETNDLLKSGIDAREKELTDIRNKYAAQKQIVIEAINYQMQLGDAADTAELQRLNALLATLNEIENKANLQVDVDIDTKGLDKGTSAIDKMYSAITNVMENGFSQDSLGDIVSGFQWLEGQISNIVGSINQVQNNKEQEAFNQYSASQDARKEELQDRLDAGLISQEKYNAEIEKIDKETEAKELEMKRIQFEREKKAATTQALIQGALGIAMIWANNANSLPGIIIAGILTGLMAAQTAAQIAVINSQPQPYAKGGYIESERIIRAGEAGREWIASNKLLNDATTAPVVAALDDYQMGKLNAFDISNLSVPYEKTMSTTASQIGANFGERNQRQVIKNTYINNDKEMLKEMKTLNRHMSNPKNRQSVLNRNMQMEFERNEDTLRNYASL